jgi:NurA-like 5'-3' nuclease
MNMFMLGLLSGIAVFALIYSVFMLNKLQAGLILLSQNLDTHGKAIQMMFLKVNKIEKITENTMQASETFVDALRESAEQMMSMRPRNNQDDDSEQFDDLRKSFEDGIRRMEEDDEEGEEDSDNKWKK